MSKLQNLYVYQFRHPTIFQKKLPLSNLDTHLKAMLSILCIGLNTYIRARSLKRISEVSNRKFFFVVGTGFEPV